MKMSKVIQLKGRLVKEIFKVFTYRLAKKDTISLIIKVI
ncbi:hypothetical protein DF16_orf03871 [Bacillus thuringiensis serovar kurstaki str. YBT-1520]|nr:hypothetical protein HD73_2384 [Bacillus thuringiensis serovar kurstaki str. HD73]AIM32286.1 hypothetical protein DF16_orf03871 [Bacillus thuringiensis serovar kurstaki str. YBT-1520]EEM53677.1 hypothetical protein bthur0006_19230 [Bacillus thuringiensis serovar kurstaki str. T03a001]KEH47139.1 hypothetical protein BG09_4141 [Bacillus thuringiensis serovar kurstaki str. HD-1]KLA28801.1 hypothetical protein B4158_2116 [Bacillus cereus]